VMVFSMTSIYPCPAPPGKEPTTLSTPAYPTDRLPRARLVTPV
jgi:hypothetical protein